MIRFFTPNIPNTLPRVKTDVPVVASRRAADRGVGTTAGNNISNRPGF